MATISTLAVNLIARTSVFEKGMKRSRRSLKGFKNDTALATRRLVSFAKGLLVSGGAVFAIKEFTNAASRAQETMNLFNVVFAENAAETAKWADSFAKNIGRSRTEVKEWAATLQDTFVPLGFARDRAAELSKTLVELAVDIGSFKNIASDAEVIDALTSAIVGNHRAVRRFGIVITEGEIKLEAMRVGIQKNFKELTSLEKVQLRYNIILKASRDAQGDAVRTADNYANRVKKLKGQWVDLKETIGKTILPAMTKLLGSLIKNKDAIVGVTKKLLVFVAKTVIIVGSINLVIKAVLLLVKAFKGLAVARAIVLSLAGPAGWAVLAASAAVAASAIVVINDAIDGVVDGIKNIGTAASDIRRPLRTIKELETRISSLKKALKQEKSISGSVSGAFGVPSDFGITSLKKMIQIRQEQLDILVKEKREQAAIAALEAKRLKDKEHFLALVKLGGEAIKKRLEANLDLKKIEDPDKAGIGRFQQIRSEFIDVAALNPAANTVTELQQLNKKTDVSNELLRELNRNAIGVFQA